MLTPTESTSSLIVKWGLLVLLALVVLCGLGGTCLFVLLAVTGTLTGN